MKNDEYRLCKLKYELKILKEKNSKFTIRKLTEEERAYVESLGYKVLPHIYEVRTKRIRSQMALENEKVRKVNEAYEKGIKIISLKISKETRKIFDKYSIEYSPIKYKIILKLQQKKK